MTQTEIRFGDWIQTQSGIRFYPVDPRPAEVSHLDIGHALSMIVRYNGHCSRFYSVAEHCVLMAEWVRKEAPTDYLQQLIALMHDASEAYLLDVPSPVKRLPVMAWYNIAEQRILQVIAEAYGLEGIEKTPLVGEADRRIVVDEMSELLRVPSLEWERVRGPRLGVTIEGWAPPKAKRLWLDRPCTAEVVCTKNLASAR